MSFADLVHKAWRGNHLFSALLELTYRCNWDCYFCYNDLALRGKPLSREQYFRLFEDLRSLGTLNLILSGGEPLAHPQFFALGARARELGFVVRVKSNGHAIRGAVARRLKEEVDPFVVEVSLHGARAATHDRQTRVEGSFERLLANVEGMQRLGLRVQMNSTLTAWNEDEMEEMMALARDLGLPLQVDPEVTPRDDGDTEPLSIRPSRQAVLRLLRLRHATRRQAAESADEPEAVSVGRDADATLPAAADGAKHCGAGSATVAVDPYGTVYPCVQWRRPVGNLHRRSMVEIWQRNDTLEEIRAATQQVRSTLAGLGEAAQGVAFCPGSAVAAGGAPDALYPSAAARMALEREAREAEGSEKGRALLPVLR